MKWANLYTANMDSSVHNPLSASDPTADNDDLLFHEDQTLCYEHLTN